MFRRLIFAYCFTFSYGIIAAYITCERLKPVHAAVMMLIAGLVICCIPAEGSPIRENPLRWRLMIMMVMGFAVFCLRYVYYNQHNGFEERRIEGRVTSVEVKEDYARITVRTDCDKYSVSLDGEAAAIPKTGDLVECKGKKKLPERQMNPHCFDYGLYLMSCGIKYQFKADSVRITGKDNSLLGVYRNALYERRDIFLEAIGSEESKAFISGVVFGDKSMLDESTIEEFNGNATGHVLAVSGLHIGFVFALLKRLTRRRNTKAAAALMVASVFLYGEMTMWSAATVRAVIVMSLKTVSRFVRRPFDMLSAVSAAAILLLVRNPYQMFNTGFQMSFLAMLGIAFFSSFMTNILGDYAGMLVSVQLATAPFTAFVFHRFNALSILINIPIVFIASVLVPVCILCLVITAVIGNAPIPGIRLAEGMAELMDKVNSLMFMDGSFSNSVASEGAGYLIALYLILFVLGSEWTRVRLLRKDVRIVAISFIVIVIASAVINSSLGDFDRADIVFISVGQGDSTHVRDNGSNVLIDGGGRMEYNVGEKIIMPYLLANGVEEVNAAVMTHLHMDHYRGITELSRVMPINTVLIPGMFSLDEGACDAKLINCGDRINVGKSTYIEAVWPVSTSPNTKAGSSDMNENNMAYMIHCHGTKVLVMGDMTGEEECKMSEYYKGTEILNCNILRVSHHGSNSSTTEDLLAAADPEVAVISVGKDNMYGHPGEECLERLSLKGIQIYRTDINGAVGIRCNANDIVPRVKEYSIVTMH